MGKAAPGIVSLGGKVFTLQPTAWSIHRGNIVLNRRFVEANAHEIDWQAFEISLFGTVISRRSHLDQQRRLGLKLRGHVSVGDSLRFSVFDRRLVVEKNNDLT